MNKLKILKINISSTSVLSIVILLCLLFALIFLPMSINELMGYENNDDLELYSEELADYCVIDFPKYFYKDLCTTFDMENYAGTAYVGGYFDNLGNSYSIQIISDKMVKGLPTLSYSFSKTKPKDYKEAYAPFNFRYKLNVGDEMEISCDKGRYEYKQKIKIIGFTDSDKDKEFYNFSYYAANLNASLQGSFLIYDDIPSYARVTSGLMMSDKSAEHYQRLGAEARTMRELNESQKYSYSNDSVIYWVGSLLVLLSIAIAANYYFSVDKMTKRSGIMAVYGATRSDIVTIELIKLIIIFAVAFVLSALYTTIMIIATTGTVTWLSYAIGLGITLVLFVVSVTFGFVKFAKFKPLEALSNSNLE